MNKTEIIEFLKSETTKPYFKELILELKNIMKIKNICPDIKNLLACFSLIKKDISVIILGQDPYPHKGVADGLAFSSNRSDYFPKSLQNIFKEIKKDYPKVVFKSFSLRNWASQGVLLLNTILSTNENEILAHKDLSAYPIFINAVFKKLWESKQRYIFVLLGQKAIMYKEKINLNKDIVLCASHPSPLGYSKSSKYTIAFKDSKIFSQINNQLRHINKDEIDWSTD